MPEIIRQEQRKARKLHTCDYCGDAIRPGEIYDYTVLRFDDIYEWKSHVRCSFIASALWEYIDPDEGMTEEDFQQGCSDFCRAFICPRCPDADIEAEECKLDENYCIDRIYDFLQTHDLRRVRDEHGWMYTFKCFPKEIKEGRASGRYDGWDRNDLIGRIRGLEHEYETLGERYRALDLELSSARFKIQNELEPRIQAEGRAYDRWVTDPER